MHWRMGSGLRTYIVQSESITLPGLQFFQACLARYLDEPFCVMPTALFMERRVWRHCTASSLHEVYLVRTKQFTVIFSIHCNVVKKAQIPSLMKFAHLVNLSSEMTCGVVHKPREPRMHHHANVQLPEPLYLLASHYHSHLWHDNIATHIYHSTTTNEKRKSLTRDLITLHHTCQVLNDSLTYTLHTRDPQTTPFHTPYPYVTRASQAHSNIPVLGHIRCRLVAIASHHARCVLKSRHHKQHIIKSLEFAHQVLT